MYAGPAEICDADGTCIAQCMPDMLFTENETNTQRLYGVENYTPHTKDAFHRHIIHNESGVLKPDGRGTKVGFRYNATIESKGKIVIRMRLRGSKSVPLSHPSHVVVASQLDEIIAKRKAEADAFYHSRTLVAHLTPDEVNVARQAYAGLLWSKQFYHYVVQDWIKGDPGMPVPPAQRLHARNSDWRHVYCRDIISMPDKWEYPWFAAWDLAFHMIPMARVDPNFAKEQLVLLLREWYMHANGQIPAYEFAFDDVNPPVHAWAVWRVFKLDAHNNPNGEDLEFLARAFFKLMLNFTWWVNRKDERGHNLFGGGFLGLDNIGVFDRGKPLPMGGKLEQADGTSWMAFYCVTMLEMSLKLARKEPAYQDIASKFFEHFVQIVDAINGSADCPGLWDEESGFYFDRISFDDGTSHFLKISSLVAIIPLFACLVLESSVLDAMPNFRKRLLWFMKNRNDLSKSISFMVDIEGMGADADKAGSSTRRLILAIPSREKLTRVLKRVLDEEQFLSPFGIRSLSKVYEKQPFIYRNNGQEYRVQYTPGESNSPIYGGNSNWRGPVWMPTNWLLIESLNRYHYFYGKSFQIECPTGSGNMMTLDLVAKELTQRLSKLFLKTDSGSRPCFGSLSELYNQEGWENLVLFHEYFDPETGRGCGASHQTGWTSLVTACLEKLSRVRDREAAAGVGAGAGASSASKH